MGKVELKFDTKLAFDGNRTRTPSLPGLGSPSNPGTDLTFRPRKLTVSFPVSSYLCVKPNSLCLHIREGEYTKGGHIAVIGHRVRNQAPVLVFLFFLYLTITLSLMYSDAYNARIIG